MERGVKPFNLEEEMTTIKGMVLVSRHNPGRGSPKRNAEGAIEVFTSHPFDNYNGSFEYGWQDVELTFSGELPEDLLKTIEKGD